MALVELMDVVVRLDLSDGSGRVVSHDHALMDQPTLIEERPDRSILVDDHVIGRMIRCFVPPKREDHAVLVGDVPPLAELTHHLVLDEVDDRRQVVFRYRMDTGELDALVAPIRERRAGLARADVHVVFGEDAPSWGFSARHMVSVAR